MNEKEKLYEWLSERSADELFKVAFEALTELIFTESVRVDDYGAPYWESCGDELGQD